MKKKKKESENVTKSRFRIAKLEERIAPKLTCVALPYSGCRCYNPQGKLTGAPGRCF